MSKVNKETTVQIGARTRAVALACSTDETRRVLQGVHFTDGTMEATDGRILLRALAETIDSDAVPPKIHGTTLPDDTLIPGSAIEDVSKRTPRIAHNRSLRKAFAFEGELVATDGETTHKVQHIVLDGKYPGTQQLVPESEAKAVINLGPKYLRMIADAADLIDANRVKIEVREEYDIIVFTISSRGGEEITGAVMPLRPGV